MGTDPLYPQKFAFFTIFTITVILLQFTTPLASGKPVPAEKQQLLAFHEAPEFRNGEGCDPNDTIHVSMTLDAAYLRGSVAGIFSVLRHASCPENLVFHLLAGPSRRSELHRSILSTFPYLRLHVHRFDPDLVRPMISSSIRRALDQPLNYARIYLADLLPPDVTRVIYLDSDIIFVDDIAKLWSISLLPFLLGAPEYCHANFTKYFTSRFWASPSLRRAFLGRRTACYFNTGVMVINVEGWRSQGVTRKLEAWMRVQKRTRIYELGSLPPFLLVFAGNVQAVEHRWNQHGLGGDNIEGKCRDLHPGPVSLLHWSGKGKPWLRLDSGRPCPLDSLWLPYDLFRSPLFLDE